MSTLLTIKQNELHYIIHDAITTLPCLLLPHPSPNSRFLKVQPSQIFFFWILTVIVKASVISWACISYFFFFFSLSFFLRFCCFCIFDLLKSAILCRWDDEDELLVFFKKLKVRTGEVAFVTDRRRREVILW